MPDDTPSGVVAARIRAVLVHARAAHHHAADTAAKAYAKPVTPPASPGPAVAAGTGAGGAP